MVKHKNPRAVSALDPHHPLIRRMIRAVQLRDVTTATRSDDGAARLASANATRAAHVGDLLRLCAGHIAKARPRVEIDEAAQELIDCGNGAIGQLRRPATAPDALLPIFERAIERHLCGDDGREGDDDQVRECDEHTARGEAVRACA